MEISEQARCKEVMPISRLVDLKRAPFGEVARPTRRFYADAIFRVCNTTCRKMNSARSRNIVLLGP